MLMVRIVGTEKKKRIRTKGQTSQGLKLKLTHHQPLNIFNLQMLNRFPEQYHPQRGPSQKEDSESRWN